jgi:hypothetical protein
MHDVGPELPWQYDATIVNAIPRGDVHATGTFGPWVTESPGDSTVTGHYTFANSDLGTIRGIGGTLSSVGDFDGQLDRIAVRGTTETPDFSINTANHPMMLTTQFDALVDGTTGDTHLNDVKARLGQSGMEARGNIVNIKGMGHDINLNVEVPHGRVEDFLALGVRTQPVFVTGGVGMNVKLHIPPGKGRVAEKMAVNGDFAMHGLHFTNPKVEDKVDMLSLRAQGDPKDAKPGAEDVRSALKGRFVMQRGKLDFSNLMYELPGAEVRLAGVYSLDGQQFDFHGNVQTQAKLSQMVASRWKSILLKAVDPFFAKKGKGAVIPVEIHGTKDEPHFGLDWKHRHEDDRVGASDVPRAGKR